MPEDINHDRRRFLGTAGAAALALGATQLGMTGSAKAQAGAAAASLAAMKAGANTSFGPVRQIKAGVLNVGYVEAGPARGRPVILMHGFPYDIHSYAEVTPLLAAEGYQVIVPYFRGYGTTTFISDATPRNVDQAAFALDILALMDALGIEKAILGDYVWSFNSPTWHFSEATYNQTAAAFNNPDYVSIVIGNYRWRLSEWPSEPEYASIERRLQEAPAIAVPTITIDGEYDPFTPPGNGAAYRGHFTGKYEHRIFKVGHNVPQEAPAPSPGLSSTRVVSDNTA